MRVLIERHGRPLVSDIARQIQDDLRRRVKSDPAAVAEITAEDYVVCQIERALESRMAYSLRRVFNLSGTVLHTNLGRACLPQEAIEAMTAAAATATNLEFDLNEGRRSDRDIHVEKRLIELTGAEAATCVNNNAAAVLLVLNTLAQGRRVAVSRGELVEIGGSFRLPEIMARAGCSLAEVGTTNRTHPQDYEREMSDGLALVMRVHTSNYEVRGFVKAVADRDIACMAKAHGIPYVVDLGSGALIDLQKLGLPYEPTPMAAIADGADVVTFSGDKLLGGPQAGIIVGRKDIIDLIKKNPMKRALRLDKVTIAALEAVLRLYADPERLAARLPTLRHLTRTQADIFSCAERCLPAMREALEDCAEVSVVACESQIGSGSRPTDLLPSAGFSVRPLTDKREASSALSRIAARFRRLPVPVVGRIHNRCFYLDLRCLEDEALFCGQLAAFSQTESKRPAGD